MKTRLAMLALVAVMACGGSDLLVPAATAPETFTLRSFNGGALPAVLSSSGQGDVALLDDRFHLYGDGTYLESGHVRVTQNGVTTIQTLESPGTYSRTNSAVVLVGSSGSITGSFTDASTLTIVAGSNTLVFTR